MVCLQLFILINTQNVPEKVGDEWSADDSSVSVVASENELLAVQVPLSEAYEACRVSSSRSGFDRSGEHFPSNASPTPFHLNGHILYDVAKVPLIVLFEPEFLADTPNGCFTEPSYIRVQGLKLVSYLLVGQIVVDERCQVGLNIDIVRRRFALELNA
ncbi:hypothetical protein BCR44DRAFT_36768 [Catenaria anguillulae PL171]|nr:hypothetical protein BCR44DRAFT_36768 [Catenaria anguillulae PL171]